jgi:hypothetical protein
MPFRAGAISYRRFAITGDAPNILDSKFYDALRENALGELEPTQARRDTCRLDGRPPPLRHARSTSSAIGFGGGAAARLPAFGLGARSARDQEGVHRDGGGRARVAAVEGRGGGDLSPRSAKKEAREDALRRIEEEIADGRYRRPEARADLVGLREVRRCTRPISADAEVQALRRLCDRLARRTRSRRDRAGTLALDMLAQKGRSAATTTICARRRLERAAAEIELAREDGPPCLGRSAQNFRGPRSEPQDFLGNLFALLAVAGTATCTKGIVHDRGWRGRDSRSTRRSTSSARGDLSGGSSLRGDAPTRTRRDGARGATWQVAAQDRAHACRSFGRVWECALQGDRFEVSGLKLPKPEEKPQSLRAADRGASRQFRHLRRRR